MINKDNYDKLFSRLTMILKHLYNGEELSVAEMAEEYNVSIRTIQRDFALRLEPNFPLIKKGTIWKMEDGYRLGRTNIQSEVIVLDIIENMTKSLGTIIFNKSKSLITKLKNDEESVFYTKLLFEDISNRFNDIELIEASIKKQRIMSFLHNKQQKLLKPYKILNLDGYWYLCGINIKTNRLTNMKIDKISSIKITDQKFEKIQNINEKIKCAITGNFKPYRKLIEVVLLIEEDPKIFLNRIPISPTLKIIDRNDFEGWIQISIQVTDLAEITPFIKKHMPKVFIISPKTLRDKMKEDISSYLKKIDLYTL
jgi:predicted DNA-binding transcriptional regulator YafY